MEAGNFSGCARRQAGSSVSPHPATVRRTAHSHALHAGAKHGRHASGVSSPRTAKATVCCHVRWPRMRKIAAGTSVSRRRNPPCGCLRAAHCVTCVTVRCVRGRKCSISASASAGRHAASPMRGRRAHASASASARGDTARVSTMPMPPSKASLPERSAAPARASATSGVATSMSSANLSSPQKAQKRISPRTMPGVRRRRMKGWASAHTLRRHSILTGCSGCTLQLTATAPADATVHHWLDIIDPVPAAVSPDACPV